MQKNLNNWNGLGKATPDVMENLRRYGTTKAPEKTGMSTNTILMLGAAAVALFILTK